MPTLISPGKPVAFATSLSTEKIEQDSTPACLQQFIERQAVQRPDAVAISFPESNAVQITYAELNLRANQLARHLQKSGVGPDVVVGVCVERSVEMIIAV